MKLRESVLPMEISFSTTKRKKIVAKESFIEPSNYHLGDDRQYAALVAIDGKVTFSNWYDTKEEAERAKVFLEAALDYGSYITMEEEGTYPERATIMRERYEKSGRDDPNHPMHGFYTGLATEHEQISNNNPK